MQLEWTLLLNECIRITEEKMKLVKSKAVKIEISGLIGFKDMKLQTSNVHGLNSSTNHYLAYPYKRGKTRKKWKELN